jgi:hypothetical protein
MTSNWGDEDVDADEAGFSLQAADMKLSDLYHLHEHVFCADMKEKQVLTASRVLANSKYS